MTNLIPLLTSLLTSSSGTESPITQDSFISKLIPNFWAFLVQFLAFIVMAIIVIKIGYKPVRKMLKEREENINSHIDSASRVTEEANQKNLEATERVAQSKKDADSIILEAKADAGVVKQEIIKQAQTDAENIRDNAREQMKREEQKALDDIHNQIVDVALDASKIVLEREINETDNKKLVNDFVKNVGEKK